MSQWLADWSFCSENSPHSLKSESDCQYVFIIVLVVEAFSVRDSNWVTEKFSSSNKVLIESGNVSSELLNKLSLELTKQEVSLDEKTNNSENCYQMLSMKADLSSIKNSSSSWTNFLLSDIDKI